MVTTSLLFTEAFMFLSKRKGVYYLWYKDEDGHRHKVSTRCRKKNAALEFLRSFQWPSTNRRPISSPTLAEFYASLRESLTSTHRSSTVELYDRAWGHLQSIVGNIRMADLTVLHFDRYKLVRLKGVGPVRVNIELRALRASLNQAVRWTILSANPFVMGSLVGVPENMPLTFNREQVSQLLAALRDQWLKDVVVIGLLTGMRRGELLNLRWADIDFTLALIKIQNSANFKTKTGKVRIVPMNRVVCEILGRLRTSSCGDLVFSFNGSEVPGYLVSMKLKRCIRDIGLPEGLRFHSLRRSLAW
jgi:integrase